MPHIPRKHLPTMPGKNAGDPRKEIDEAMYLQIMRKNFALRRHNLYVTCKENGWRAIGEHDQDKMEALSKAAREQLKQFPEFQRKCCELFDIKQHASDQESTKMMLKEVYLDFFTKSVQPDFVGGPFNKRISVESKEHNEICQKIISTNEPMPHLEKDPLLNKESDLSVDLRNMQGYTLKSGSTFISKDKNRVGISEGGQKTALKFINKLKNRKHSAEQDDKIVEEKEEDAEEQKDDIPVLEERKEEKTEVKEENISSVVQSSDAPQNVPVEEAGSKVEEVV